MPAADRSRARRGTLRRARVAVLVVLSGCAGVPPSSTSPSSALARSAESPSASIGASAAQAPPTQAARFARWLADYRAAALAQGIDEATLHAALDGAQYLPQVVDADRAQPEFNRPVWDYLDIAVSAQRVGAGRRKLEDVRAAATAAAGRYGVPAEVLVALWGMESDYGRVVGDTPTIDALATLGFDGRREAWARAELTDALRIVQRGDIDRDHMLGSWAGAMGQTQFLPSVFLADAVDADGDGRRDIWDSMPDVLASTAHFLARAGWRPGEPWGLEVVLPAGFDPARADPAVRQSSARWADEGVAAADGRALPAVADAAIVQPAGTRGPAFLVGANFRAILRYNNATAYALAAGLLADAIAGGTGPGGVRVRWPRDLQPLDRDQVIALQTALNAHGFDCGRPDGLAGPATRGALRDYQRSIGVAPDGFPTADLLQRLLGP